MAESSAGIGRWICSVLAIGLLAGCDAAPEYAGAFKDGKPNGQGTLTWPDGKTYVGEIKDGKPDGQGTFAFTDGYKHVGELKDGRFSSEIVGNRINVSSLNLLVLDPL